MISGMFATAATERTRPSRSLRAAVFVPGELCQLDAIQQRIKAQGACIVVVGLHQRGKLLAHVKRVLVA